MSHSGRSERAQRRAAKIRNQRIGLVVFGILLLALIAFAIFQSSNKPKQAAAPTVESPSGLVIEDLKIGEGPQAMTGNKVTVDYTGTLTDGTKFDSSKDRNKPFIFTLGVGQVIQGWDQGIVGMQVGGKRKLTIPAELGYGAEGAGALIPPNSTLIFEVELLDIQE